MIDVKRLIWEKTTGKGCYPERWEAKMPCGGGYYSVAGSRDQWEWFRNGHYVGGRHKQTPVPIEQARAAAQADYDRRILSALTGF